MPKAFSEHERSLIRARLLEQGAILFSRQGLRKTSIEELAATAGISKAAFYSFYENKESLFMDVTEQAEQRFRRDMLAVIELPGPSARARLAAVLNKGFALLKTIPILQAFTSSDYDLLFRKLPAAKLEEHLASDLAFFKEVIAHCQDAGIPIRAQPEEIGGLLYPLVLGALHADDRSQDRFGGRLDQLLELVAAFCLGEVELQA
jgi:AcrR family transcriptional regulator